MSTFSDLLNGVDLFENYGLVIQTGTAELLEFPERKETLSNDWAEHDGKEYDLDLVRFKEKEVSLNCAIMAENDDMFWDYYERFFSDLTQPGWQVLYINDHGRTYEVFYKKSGSFRKAQKKLKGVEKVFVKFQITLQVK